MSEKITLNPSRFVVNIRAPLFTEYIKNKTKERTVEEIIAIANELNYIQRQLFESTKDLPTSVRQKRKYRVRAIKEESESLNQPEEIFDESESEPEN